MPQPYKLFIIYAREDAAYLKELRGQLRPLEYAGRIQVWSDREINPGMDWEQEIVHNLDTGDIILILVSAAYYDSAYIHEKEIKYALSRHEKGEAKVLPIIVRPCSFLDDPVISRLQVLPTDGNAVTDHRHWQGNDHAWLDVVNGLKSLIDQMDRKKEGAQKEAENQQADQSAWESTISVHTIRAYQYYLKEFPHGRMASEALARIKELKYHDKGSVSSRKMAAVGVGVSMVLAVLLLFRLEYWGNKKNNPGTISDGSVRNKPDTKSGLEMIHVEGGTFTMGSPGSESGRNDDECQHSVTVRSFSISKYEVTQADWRAIMGDNPSDHKGCDDCPVENVSWNDIQQFLTKVNARYPGKNYRLPTEAEWEYAARGGQGSTYLTYAGGNNLGEVGWYSGNSDNKTHPVGTNQANRLGLFDMSGNVLEWCQDLYEPYPCNYQSSVSGTFRVLRGGNWYFDPRGCRVASRFYYGPDYRSNDIGLRLACQ